MKDLDRILSSVEELRKAIGHDMDDRILNLLQDIATDARDLGALTEQAARALLLFSEHASPPDRHTGLSVIESPEPWRAAGAFFDAAYGGTIKAQEALRG